MTFTDTFPNEYVRDEATVAALRADPDASLREIARRIGVSHTYVAKIRKRIAEDGFTTEDEPGEDEPGVTCWRPGRTFAQQDADLVAERNELFVEVQRLAVENAALRARLEAR